MAPIVATPAVVGHARLDQRSLALHRIVAAKLRRDPALLAKAHATLARWRATVSPRALPYLDEWQSLIDQGLEPLLARAIEQSEHADALRQASPLACLLSPRERQDFLRQWAADHHAPRGS